MPLPTEKQIQAAACALADKIGGTNVHGHNLISNIGIAFYALTDEEFSKVSSMCNNAAAHVRSSTKWWKSLSA